MWKCENSDICLKFLQICDIDENFPNIRSTFATAVGRSVAVVETIRLRKVRTTQSTRFLTRRCPQGYGNKEENNRLRFACGKGEKVR